MMLLAGGIFSSNSPTTTARASTGALGEAARQAYLDGLWEIYPEQMKAEINPAAVPAAAAAPRFEHLSAFLHRVLASVKATLTNE